MSLTNAKNINEEQKGDGVQDKDDNVKEEKIKEIKDNGKVTSKESNNYSVNYKAEIKNGFLGVTRLTKRVGSKKLLGNLCPTFFWKICRYLELVIV